MADNDKSKKKSKSKANKSLTVTGFELTIDSDDQQVAILSGLNLIKDKKTKTDDYEIVLFLPGYQSIELKTLELFRDSGQVLVDFPINLDDFPGNFLLVVSAGKGANREDVFTVTLQSNRNFVILQDQLDAESAARIAADSAEAIARSDADAAESLARETAVSELQSHFDTETTARIAADNAFQTNLETEAADRQAADASEASARAEADTAEELARESADTNLQSKIDTESAARTAGDNAEAEARSLAVATLQGNIESETSARTAADTAEAAARVDADAAETQAREAAVRGLQSSLDSETTARIAADNAFQTSLETEAVDRQAADANEASARAEADTAEVLARESADTNLQSKIDTESAARTAGDNAEAAARETAVAALQGSIDAEATARTAADNAEASARADADAAETQARETAFSGLQNDFKAESATRIAADNTEVSARIAGDANLQSRIDVNVSGISANVAAIHENSDDIAANTAAIAEAGEDVWGVRERNGDVTTHLVDGRVVIGTQSSYGSKLTVRRIRHEIDFNSDTWDTIGNGYVAVFHNEEKGNSDGIAVILDKENPTTSENNFMTFVRQSADGARHVVGRIEGFDKDNDGEWTAPPSIFGNLDVTFRSSAFNGLGGAPSVSMSNRSINIPVVGSSINVPDLSTLSLDTGWVSKDGLKTLFTGIGSGEFLSITGLPSENRMTDLVEWGLKNNVQNFIKPNPVGVAIAALMTEATKLAKHEGITYGSKGADYAEWLPKLDPEETFQFGQIVGVHGGRISKKTEGADQILAVSLAPIVLGNTPPEGEEDSYEKVGFMGQVPVVVKGEVNRGDYILASGLQDGTGVAISPDDVKLGHLSKIVGIAWSESSNDIGGFINVAVGLNTHEWVRIFSRHQSQVDQLASENTKLVEDYKYLAIRLEAVEKQSVITATLQEENQKLKSNIQAIQDRTAELEMTLRAIQKQITRNASLRPDRERVSGFKNITHTN